MAPLSVMTLVSVGVFIALLRLKRQQPVTQPRGARRYRQKALWWLVPLFLVQAYVAMQRHNYSAMLMMAIAILVIAVAALRDPIKSEEITNWRMDRSKCGRCEYDLTANVTGICPECGWQIPGDEARVETKEWMRFWKKWEIDYLENWRKTLLTVGASAAFSGLCLGYIIWLRVWPFTVFISALFSMGLIQVVRVIQYGMRFSKESAGEARS